MTTSNMACNSETNLPISPRSEQSLTCTSSIGGDFAVNSYVFVDLETSHLDTFDRPTIIEMSLVAVHRTGLLHPDVHVSLQEARRSDGTFDLRKLVLPRVVDKITLCLDPRKHTSSTTFLLTKLDNLNLGESKKLPFDESVASMLELFLQRQEAPVCLVAHNGKNFDFRLLRTELSRVHAEGKFDGMFCVDSLEAFRANFVGIHHTNGLNQQKNEPQVTSLKRKAAAGEVESDELTLSKRILHTQCDSGITLIPKEDLNATDSPTQPEMRLAGIPQESSSAGNACKPLRRSLHGQNETVVSACSASGASNLASSCGVFDSHLSSNISAQLGTHEATLVEGAASSSSSCIPCADDSPPRRTPPPPPVKSKNPHRYAYVHTDAKKPKVSYSLINIFKRTFGREPPVSHAAEGDIMSLIRVLLPRVHEFVHWADKNVTDFKDIDFYYRPRRPKRKLVF